MRPAPRTDPYVRNYLIRLLPWIGRTGVSACRILFAAFDQPGLALCPIGGFWRRVFSLARPLPSASSAPDAAAPGLFGSFLGTMGLSDFPAACMSGLWPQALPDRPVDGLRPAAGATGISRFSGMELPRMLRVSDSAGRMSRLALAPRILLPSLPPYEVGAPEGVISELNGWPACSPVNAYDAPLRTRRHDSGPWWVATAFHVRLFHSLLHAGLSRRSWCPR